MVTRKCYTCQIQKELDLFSKSAKDTKYGRKHECKDCVRDKRSGKLPKTYKRSFTGDHFTRTKITCGKCKNTKPVDDFRFHNKEKCIRHNTCRECTAEERRLQRKLNPQHNKNKLLKYHYGIDLIKYNQMLEDQEHKCSICNQKETKLSKDGTKILALSVDHCHITGKVRELLCSSCNLSLGGFKDNIQTLQNAILYLEKHN